MAKKPTKSRRPANEKTLRPVLPNAGIAAEYQRRLLALVDEMAHSVRVLLASVYGANEARIAQDIDIPANALQGQLDHLSKQWQRRFDDGAERLGEWFAQRAKSYADTTLQSILRDAGFSVQFQMSDPVRDAFQAVVHEQVGLIKSIPSQYLQQVQGAVMRSVQQGRDLNALEKELRKQRGITRRRAVLIARDQNNKATATITKLRHQELGITQARWRHSHAGKHPRPSHLKADGEIYDVDKGIYLDGKWVWPGTEINCRCTSSPIIPGFEY